MSIHQAQTRTTVVILAVRHSTEKTITWDDVIAHVLRCREHNKPMQIRRRKKTRVVRKRKRELRKLIEQQRKDMQATDARLDHAISKSE